VTVQLNFFIRPLTVELQARTLLAHNSRGIALYFASGQHPCNLAYTLGLTSKVHWYAPVLADTSVDRIHATNILHLATSHSRLGWNLDLRMLHLRLASMPAADQLDCIRLLHNFLNRAKYLATLHERCKAMQLTDKIPVDVMTRLQTSLAALQQSLLDKDPMMPQHLRNTHSLLISYPETVHLLDDAEIASIIDAAEVHTKTEIVKAAAAGKGAGSRKKVSADDL
jgi:hypothetical protein